MIGQKRVVKEWKIKLSDPPAAVKSELKYCVLKFLQHLANNALSCCILDLEQLLC